MKRVVIVICDGLRSDMVTPETTPNLLRIARNGTRFTSHGGVFPSTTRTTAASIATGCLPGRNGLEGNAVALDRGAGLEVLSVGPPEFRDTLARINGGTLKVPTMSERVKDIGGAVIYANASPGAGIFLDPDGYGHMFHREIAFAPGRVAVEPLGVGHNAEGDSAMTQRFIDHVLHDEKPPLALLWQCEPDNTQHAVPLGSPPHIDVIRAADAQAGRVYDNIGADAGDTVFICASDHGHETVSEIVDLEAILVEAGLKEGPGSPDVAIAPQGLSATIYLSEKARSRRTAIADILAADHRIGRVISGSQIADIGLNPDGGIDIVVTAKHSETPNANGVPGSAVAFQGDLKISNNVGCGQHGGAGRYEQSPFLICAGTGFEKGTVVDVASSAIDIAPSAMHHLGLGDDDMDGRVLQH